MTSAALTLLFALLVQGAIALVLLWIMGTIRIPLVANKKIPIEDVALSREAWPAREKRVSNALDNQFQLPVLLYLAAVVVLYLGPTWFEALLAWIFVLTRIAHAVIFTTDNNVGRRFWAFTLGYAVLIVFWLDMFARLFLHALSPV
jgi:hypothetical protein